jgi:hypothetical protein
LLTYHWGALDDESFQDDGFDVIEAKLDPAGALSKTAAGVRVSPLGVTDAMLAGSISFTKLADSANIARLDQAETIAAVWDFAALPTSSLVPSSDTQLVNKAYVDALASGLDPKESCRFGTLLDVAGTYSAVGGAGGTGEFTAVDFTDTLVFDLDGNVVAIGDRIVVKDEGDPTRNGIYVVTTAGAAGVMERAPDMDGSPANEVSGGNFTFVELGATLAGSSWVVVGDGVLTLNTDDIIWTQVSGVAFTAGDGLAFAGSVLNVVATDFSGLLAAL